MNLTINPLSERINSLRDKDVRVMLTSGEDINGTLSEVLTDALILKDNAGDAVIVASSCIAAIAERSKQPQLPLVFSAPQKPIVGNPNI